MHGKDQSTKLSVAYILDVFPVISETFIVREISGLLESDVEVVPFARVERSGANQIVHSDSKALISSVEFIDAWHDQVSRLSLLWSHTRRFFTHPVRYLRTLKFVFANKHMPNRLSLFVWSVYLTNRVIDSRCTHMHAHFALKATTLAMLVSKLSGLPFSFTVHAHDIFRDGLADWLEEKLEAAAFVATISEFNKNFLNGKFGTPVDKFRTIHCGINLEDFRFEQRSFSSDHLNIVGIGRLTPQKGFHTLIEACGNLLKEGFDSFSVSLLGEGEQRAELEALIREHQCENHVILYGAVSQDQVRDHLARADLFALPCATEPNGAMDGIPVALMEAMASGLPVLSAKLSGVPELIVDGAGLLADTEDPNSVSELIKHFYNMDSTARLNMASNARRVIEEQFNITTEVEKLRSHFRELPKG